MRKPLSDLTARDIVEMTGALNLTYKELAAQLGLNPTSISHYISGRHPIPQDVANKLAQLIETKQEELARHLNTARRPSVNEMLIYHNEQRLLERRTTPAPNEARFARKQRLPNTHTWPKYRLSVRKRTLLAEALKAWLAHVRELARTYTDQARQRDYRLEVVDIKAIADNIPRVMPYDITITEAEWDVVSRALRFLYKRFNRPDAYAVYQHWRRHRQAGYPLHRMD